MDEESATGMKAGLLRRLAALVYDLLLVVAVAFAATFAMLPLTGGEAILTSTQGPVVHLYHAVLLLAVFAYFGWCWTQSGQTLGMKAWRIRLEAPDGRRLSWPGALVRFALGTALAWMAAFGGWYLARPDGVVGGAGAAAMIAPLAANFAWIPFEAAGRSLLDLASRSRVVRAR
jgi:uncharacterized RDD family membrane protein YckC